MAGGDLGSVELCLGRESVALGGGADHLRDGIGQVGWRRVDEKIPIRVVLV
jgi:hypothetical protein